MIRLATYNVEWMNALFDDAGTPLLDAEPSARHQITRAQQLTALGAVFTAMNADGAMIIEAPDQSDRRSTTRALEAFAAHFHLRTTRAIIGIASATEQEIAFLYDPSRLTVAHDPADLGPDDRIIFSKPPLELTVTTPTQTLHLIGVHAKSKAPHGRVTPEDFRRISIDNRRKQLAECHWLRTRAETHLAAGDNLIVMGDFNDGPGIDEYEQTFGQSGVEVVMGLTATPNMRLTDPHAMMALSNRIGLQPTSARFWLAPAKRYFEALLDFIMVSPTLAVQNPEWRIWHPFNDPEIPPDLSKAILTASDHFPVTIDL